MVGLVSEALGAGVECETLGRGGNEARVFLSPIFGEAIGVNCLIFHSFSCYKMQIPERDVVVE